MPKFAANLTMMYTECTFLDRFAAAAKDGFEGVEFLFPYDFPAEEIKSRLDKCGLTQVLFNCPPGDWNAGERGIASLAGRQDEFKSGVETALTYARKFGTRRLHVMAGLTQADFAHSDQSAIFIDNLRYAAKRADECDVTILIEPINTRDMPEYFLTTQDQALHICSEVAATNIRVQMDLYHCQIMEGDLAAKIRRNLHKIGHLQIAGVPDRHEPDIGEINYPYLFKLLDDVDYEGWIGCEYRPLAGTTEGLKWFHEYCKR